MNLCKKQEIYTDRKHSRIIWCALKDSWITKTAVEKKSKKIGAWYWTMMNHGINFKTYTICWILHANMHNSVTQRSIRSEQDSVLSEQCGQWTCPRIPISILLSWILFILAFYLSAASVSFCLINELKTFYLLRCV